jgi:hypothetical protein
MEKRTMKTMPRMLIAATAVAALFAAPAWPQPQERTMAQAAAPQESRSNIPPRGEAARKIEDLRMEKVPGEAIPLPVVRGWRQVVSCQANSPADVVGFRVECNNATYLDFQISDCCMASDHWQLKGKSWDTYPNTTVTTSPDLPSAGGILYGLPARIYNYGGTTSAPRRLDAYIECSYLNGVNVFPAGSSAILSSNGTCTVTQDPAVRRIDRTP